MRVDLVPAWVLHRRDYRDSSQIVELLTGEHGRVAVVARGIKQPRSRHRGLLQPFSPVSVSWSGRGELGTLTQVDALGAPLMLSGDALLAGFYVTELCLRLTTRHDPSPELFALYSRTIAGLTGTDELDVAVRTFELDLLSELGFGIDWCTDGATGRAIQAELEYRLAPDAGPQVASPGAADAVPGHVLLAIARRDWSRTQTRRAARHILATALDRHLEGRPLETRRVMQALHARRKSEP